jgi:predicted acyl esterase
MGRAGWFDEVMRFYDEHLRGVAPTVADPANAVETSDGTWRAEDAWPPKDSSPVSSPLRRGSYADDGQNNGTAEGGTPNGKGIWTFSEPLAADAHLAGVPRVTVDAAPALPGANLVLDVYDVDGSGAATLISRSATLVDKPGPVSFDLYGNDWKLPAGHRVGVLVTGANAEWWAHVPTLQTVTVRSATIELPFLTCRRTASIQGDPSVKLEDYRTSAPFAVDPATVAAATSPELAVPALQDCS